MKRLLTMIVGLAIASSFAATETVDGITWTYTVNNGEASVGGESYSSTAVHKSTTGEITIPSKLGGYRVTSIGDGAFLCCIGLTSVTIPSSVTSIGESAFYGCESLTSVTIPDSVTSIGDYAFFCCSGLMSVTIPNSVTHIGNYAFLGCDGLADANGFIIVRNVLYGYNGDGGNVIIYDGVTSIGDCAFSGCSGLTSVTIPSSVRSIGEYAFDECESLASVTMKGNCPDIGDGVFDGVNSGCTVYVLRVSRGWNVDIPGKWKGLDIDYYSTEPGYPVFIVENGVLMNVDLNGCKAIEIPSSVTAIGNRAFAGCEDMKSVTIPDSVTNIGSDAFSYCSGLTNLTIGSGVTSIGTAAFFECSGLTSVTIPNSVTNIEGLAFMYCRGLASITIPDSVARIGQYAFCECPAYEINLARMAFGGGAQYALSSTPADRAIASITVDGDRAIDDFVLKDGKVYDSVLYINNTAANDVTLTLPSGYTYKAIKGAKPLSIPANSQSILSITRVAANVFLVSREDLETIE